MSACSTCILYWTCTSPWPPVPWSSAPEEVCTHSQAAWQCWGGRSTQQSGGDPSQTAKNRKTSKHSTSKLQCVFISATHWVVRKRMTWAVLCKSPCSVPTAPALVGLVYCTLDWFHPTSHFWLLPVQHTPPGINKHTMLSRAVVWCLTYELWCMYLMVKI